MSPGQAAKAVVQQAKEEDGLRAVAVRTRAGDQG